MKTALIITERFDPTSDSVIQALNERGAPFLRWNLDTYPQGSSLTYRASARGFDGMVSSDGQTVSFDRIGSVWYRASAPGGFPASLSSKDHEFALREAELVLTSLPAVTGWHWINEPRRDRDGSRKPTQLAVAQRLGLKTPRTVITNDPDCVRSFYEECGGKAIYKSLSPAMNLEPGKLLFTSPLTEENLSQIVLIQNTPGIFQELIPKDYEVRLTVVGDKMFAAKIFSQQDERTRFDRRAAALDLQYEATDLPLAVRNKVSAFMNAFGLVYSCLDFIVTPEGHYVFLENNPRGQYLWIENYTGMLITEAIADRLIIE